MAKADWQYEVANGDTKLGYVEWLEHQREAENRALPSRPWVVIEGGLAADMSPDVIVVDMDFIDEGDPTDLLDVERAEDYLEWLAGMGAGEDSYYYKRVSAFLRAAGAVDTI